MVDTLVSGASASRRVGSTPIIRTKRSVVKAGRFLVTDLADRFAELSFKVRDTGTIK